MSNLKSFKIGNHVIGNGERPFYIAEMSGNHNHSLDKALAIVDAAAKAGADALKIQTYTADTMTLDITEGEFSINDPNSLWHGKSLYELYKIASTPYDWHEPILKRCQDHGMEFFSTPFDLTSVDFLEDLGVGFYKVASFENTDKKLIEKVSQTKKPVIISTGMASVSELNEMVSWARNAGCSDLVLLKCTSAYPALAKDANIATIPHMTKLLDVHTGLSDHTLGIGVAVASVVMGACVIEKHFCLDRSEGGVDSAFSLEPSEFANLVEECNRAYDAVGEVSYKRGEKEQKSLQFRRTLYVVEDVRKGEEFSEKNIRAIRPGSGLPVKYFDSFMGKTSTKDIKKGTPLNWDLLS